MARLKLINFAAFQLGWFACVLGAGGDRPWLGPVAAGALLALHARLSRHPAADFRVILGVGVFGVIVDSLQAAFGVFEPRHAIGPVWLCPPWLAALWLLFGSTLNSSLSWLVGRPALAALLGAGAGPLAYAAGAKLGALTLAESRALALGSLAGVWGAGMPLLMAWAGRSPSRVGPAG